MPTIDETIAFIQRAHADQTDKAGGPYWRHPVAVMRLLPDGVPETWRLAALLHDVIEDTPATRAELEALGYVAETLDIVEAVSTALYAGTYVEKIDTMIRRGAPGPIVVKYADMTHNLDPIRLGALDGATRNRLELRYRIPYARLRAAVRGLGYPV